MNRQELKALIIKKMNEGEGYLNKYSSHSEPVKTSSSEKQNNKTEKTE